MLDKKYFVTDNFLSPVEYAELRWHFETVRLQGLAEAGNQYDGFVRYPHYDAYGFVPSANVWTPNDFRKRVYSPENLANVGRQFGAQLTPEGTVEYHYHHANGAAGAPHADNEWVNIPAERRAEEPCKGMSFWQARNQYRGDAVNCIKRKRVIGNLLYLNDDWRDGDGGQTAFYGREPDGSFVKQFAIDPLPNRVLSFMTDKNSWHGSISQVNPRRVVAWWYHGE